MNKTLSIISMFLICFIPIAFALDLIWVESDVRFHPIDTTAYYTVNFISNASTILINNTCVVIDNSTNISGVDTCSASGQFNINFTVTTTTTTTSATTTTTLPNKGIATLDWTPFFQDDLNLSSLEMICIKITKTVCYNFTSDAWQVG